MDNNCLTRVLKTHPIIDVNIIKANNTTLLTDDYREIRDFESGIWCTALGHNNSFINGVIKDQLNKVSHLNTRLVSKLAEKLAILLTDIVNFDNGKAVFLSSGSEAVEMAVTLAKITTDRTMLLSFTNSYLSAYRHMSMPRSKDNWQEIDFTLCDGCRKNCCSDCELIRDIDFSKFAAFVLEPGNSGGRVLLPPAKLVEFLTTKIQHYGGKLVINEVTTGFGRTGEWFGYMHYNVKPDLIAMGKALGNGYPISAVVLTSELAKSVEDKKFGYAQSHQNDPLGCRIACEVIRVFKEQNMIERSQKLGRFFVEQLKYINSPLIKDIRARGLMIALEFTQSGYAEQLFAKLYEQGFYVGCIPIVNMLRFYPAITTKKQHITELCSTIGKILDELKITNNE